MCAADNRNTSVIHQLVVAKAGLDLQDKVGELPL